MLPQDCTRLSLSLVIGESGDHPAHEWNIGLADLDF